MINLRKQIKVTTNSIFHHVNSFMMIYYKSRFFSIDQSNIRREDFRKAECLCSESYILSDGFSDFMFMKQRDYFIYFKSSCQKVTECYVIFGGGQ